MKINIVFDGPPGHMPGRFVEVEDLDGNSVKVGEWSPHPATVITADGNVLDLWHLQIEVPDETVTR